MNISVYVFGCLGNGYTQYPDDYAKVIYQSFYAKSTASSQITIHRDNNLIYYGYIRKLDVSSQYIGFCVLLNGIMFSQIGRLFPIFENAVADLVARGEILHFSDRGEVTSSITNLNERQQEVERIVSVIQNQISDLGSYTRKLPPVSYGVSNNESKTFSESDKNEDIVNASCKFGYTYVLKDKDYDTVSLSSYKSVLIRLNKEKDNLYNNYSELKTKYEKLTEQKKQYKKVVVLCVLIALCGIGLFFLKDSLDNTRNNLKDARNDITQKEGMIKTRDEKIVSLESSLSAEQSRRESAENELTELKNSYSDYMPVIITDVEIANVYNDGSVETDYGGTIYSSYSMYVKPKITYKGIKTGESISLDIKLYTPSGLSRGSSSPSDCSWTESFYVSSGSNTQSFQGWGGSSKGHWTSGTYRYEFWYGNVCLKAKSFTIH
ncbi:MAG: hypothetical protein J5913_03435 [Prevotella sp.]|nr:hypothetical protein [Prevotella sp.]